MADNVTNEEVVQNSEAGSESSDNATQALSNLLNEVNNERMNQAGNATDNAQQGSLSNLANVLQNSAEGLANDRQQSPRNSESLGNALKELLNNSQGSATDRAQNGAEKAIDKNQLPSEAIGKLRDQIKDGSGIGGILEKFAKKDGVKELPTGDYLVRQDGKETLFTPNGDRVSVNPDGTLDVKGDVKSVKQDKNGETTITFGDGSKVTVDKEGILNVSRGNESVSFPRFRQQERINPGHLKPLPTDGSRGGGGGGGGGKGGGKEIQGDSHPGEKESTKPHNTERLEKPAVFENLKPLTKPPVNALPELEIKKR